MTITAWRIYLPKHAASAFTGDGARLFGGRFNSRGVPVVYTAGSISLAALELLVHLRSADVLSMYQLRSVTFDVALVTKLDPRRLPKTWRRYPASAAVRRIGDEWIAAGVSAVLEVPSVVVESESNYLLNPAHPDFGRIVIGNAKRFRFDARLLKS